MRDLSVIIPARNEMFLAKTVENILEQKRANTEVIVVLDGYWPENFERFYNHDDVVILHYARFIGQRAATNQGANVSRAEYVMKIDAHCAVDEGFDVKLMQDCKPDWTMVPSQYNLHAFDWVCDNCKHRQYQGVQPKQCTSCGKNNFTMDIVWQPRTNRRTVSWRFDNNLQFQYWREHSNRPEAKGDLIETMSFIGACMLLRRERYWYLDGLDEGHGGWGQFGTEIACKTWLSGGKLITSKKTWFAHMFRTGNFSAPGVSSFPYPLSQRDIDKARKYSQDMWFNNKWPKAKYPLQWLVDRFAPVKGWPHPSEGA